jgi:OHCU decarboxylase
VNSTPSLRAKLLAYCGSEAWVGEMARHWPYRDTDELLAASEHAFDALSREDWLEAFAAHARIGAPKDGDPRGAAEQAGVADAAATELAELARLNAAYEQRFGHVFLICASGLSAAEMLAELRARSVNPAATEFENAKREQRKITALRLRSALPSRETPSGALPT